jgi:cell division transport system ATP-binding protein
MIELRNVSKIYKNNKYALNDISLVISAGEFVYVVGHSGAGKSTLLRLIYRQEKATKGTVVINGRDVSKIRYRQVPSYRRDVGFVFQDYQLLPHKTAYENIAYALEVRGEHRREIQVRVREVLELVGLKDKERSYPAQLSGGEQQRVAIARAIINRPSILIADEPTGNLDPMTSRTIIEVLETINKLGTTVVVATHDQYMVNNHPQRTITFKNGVIYHDAMDSGYVVGDDDFDTAALDMGTLSTQANMSILDAVRNELEEGKQFSRAETEITTDVQEEFRELFAEQEKKRQAAAEADVEVGLEKTNEVVRPHKRSDDFMRADNSVLHSVVSEEKEQMTRARRRKEAK